MNRRRIGTVLVLAALALACFAGLLGDPTALIVDADRPSRDYARTVDDPSAGNDLTRLFLPHHLAIARAIAKHGHLPLWDERGFGGRPMVGNPQAGLFYPPTWLAWWSEVPSTLGWITVGHLLFSGLGAYRLARTLGSSGWGSLVAAGCVQTSPYVLAQTFEGHYPHVWAACWYPWAFDAAIRIQRGQSRAAPALALCLAATFLTGHPQEAYYLVVALGSWAVYMGIAAILAGRRRDARRLWGLWALAVVLAVGLIGVELIPDALAQPWCLRGARLPLRLASRYHLSPTNALQILSPTALGGPAEYFGHENYWESVTSIGLIPLLLACVAVSMATDRRALRGWLILVAASVIFASGRKLGLFALVYEVVPGMDRFRVPARSLFLASLGASMLAGMGVDALCARLEDDRAWGRLARRVAVLAFLLIVAVHVGGQMSTGGEASGIEQVKEADRWRMGLDRLARDRIFLGALGGGVLLLAYGWHRPVDRRAVAVMFGLLGLVELAAHGHALIETSPADRFLGPDPISVALEGAHPPGLEPPRIRVDGPVYGDLRAGLRGFSKTDVNDSFQIQHAADLYQALYRRRRESMIRGGPPKPGDIARRSREAQAVLDLMAVSFQVLGRRDPAEPEQSLVGSGSWQGLPYAIYRNPTALPRAYVVPRARPVADDASILATIPEVDPREAVLMPADPLGLDSSDRQPFTPAEWDSSDPDRVALRVSTRLPGLLVVADTWMPGWSAEVDGEPQPLKKGNRGQRIIPLPRPGRHEVILTYHPPGLKLGLALTAVSALAELILSLAPAFRRRDVRSSDDCH